MNPQAIVSLKCGIIHLSAGARAIEFLVPALNIINKKQPRMPAPVGGEKVVSSARQKKVAGEQT